MKYQDGFSINIIDNRTGPVAVLGPVFFCVINKHMAISISQIEDKIKKAGYSDIKRVTASRLVIYTEDDRKTALNTIAQEIGGRYTSNRIGSGWKSSVGATLLGSFVILAKPLTKGVKGNVASLDARVFSKGATTSTFLYADQEVAVAKFTSANEIKDSILKGMRDSPLLGEAYEEMFKSFFETGKIDWAPNTPAAMINKLGVYVGELLIGWVLLSKKAPAYFTRNPFTGTAKAFYLPTDPSFSGVDSFIEMSDGSYYGISSKFGKGAKASIFTNLIKIGMEKESKLKSSVFKDICSIAKNNNLKYTASRAIVYNYGIRKILGISSSQINSPDSIYAQAYSGKSSKELDMVVGAVLRISDNKDIKAALPNSISSFFNRTIAQQLNDDAESLSQIEQILTGKDYWQANLDINKWTKGTVYFSFVKSSGAVIKIYGNKSAISDLTSKQGWINYELS